MSDGRGEDDGDRAAAGERAAEEGDEFSNLVGHFYRGEMDRITTWRSRLDQTTNWAVVVMASVLTWAFSSESNPHYVLLVGMLTVATFCLIEAQRYRKYDFWRARVRLLQEDLFAEVSDPSGAERGDWRKRLGTDLRHPELRLPYWQAVAHRLRHIYLPLLIVLLAAWLFRITVFAADEPWRTTASVADLSGTIVAAVVGGTFAVLLALTLAGALRSGEREFEEPGEDESLRPGA